MLKCKEVTELASQQLDQPLSLRQRIGMKLHLMICRYCRNYTKHLQLLKQIAPRLEQRIEADEQISLSDEAKARLKSTINEHS